MSSIYYKNQKYTGPTLDLGSGSLTTDNKTIVGAINELNATVDELLNVKAIDNIYLASTATIDDLFSAIGNAIYSRGTGKTIVFSATWDGHDLFTGQGLYKWGVTFFMVANGTYIYVVTFNISTQTISYKKRVLVSSFE